jgi:Xaa-Pro aminopeptidase
MEAGYVRSQAAFEDIRVYREFKEKPMDFLADAIQDLGLANSRVSIELDYLPARDYAYLVQRLPNVQWVDAEKLYWDLRMRKTPEEIAALTKIGKIAERTHHVAFGQLRPGMKEKDLEKMVMEELYAAGADRVMKIIIGSGERSGFPNCLATDRVIGEGDLIRMDILAISDNYLSDCARTAVVGPPSDEYKAYWQKMVDTHKATLEMVKPGVHTDDIYRVYCTKFEEYGLPIANFLGHGLGLTTHEYPYIGIHGGAVLEENMVLCMEPFWFGAEAGMGFQLEDEIVITRDGYEQITNHAPTDRLIQVQ